jgi:hypothetical protein
MNSKMIDCNAVHGAGVGAISFLNQNLLTPVGITAVTWPEPPLIDRPPVRTYSLLRRQCREGYL